jgi:hypothetical protein
LGKEACVWSAIGNTIMGGVGKIGINATRTTKNGELRTKKKHLCTIINGYPITGLI